MNENNNVADNKKYQSVVLKKLGFTNILELLQSCRNSSINLGKPDLISMSNKQLNSLISLQGALSTRGYMAYFDENKNLLISSQYHFNRNVREEQNIYYEEMYLEPHLDYIFGESALQ